jgi:hypothetical protein
LLQIFKHATLFFSRDTPNITTVIPAMDIIDEHLATSADSIVFVTSIRSALAIGKRTLNRYYDKTDYSENYRIAMSELKWFIFAFFRITNIIVCLLVLHPRHKLEYFKGAGWKDSWIKAAREIVRDEYDRSYAFMDIDVPVAADEVSNSLSLISL